MSAVFNCELKPSDLNNEIRQFMSDISGQCQEIGKQTFSFTRSVIISAGTICYANRDFTADKELAPFWQLADGSAAQGELKSALNWQNVPNLLSTFLEVAPAQDWARYGSNNKKHRHYFVLGAETNRQTQTPLWRSFYGKTQDANRNFYPPSGRSQYSRDFEIVLPHAHDVIVADDGGDEFRPDYVRFTPFICHTKMS